MPDSKHHNLILNVENFGPIASAKDIEIRPMTVFVGPSNTGKSYLAILLHSVLQALDALTILPRQRAVQHVQSHLEQYETFLKDINETEIINDEDDLNGFITIELNALSAQSKMLVKDIRDEWRDDLINELNSSTSDFFEVTDIGELNSGSEHKKLQPSITIQSVDSEWVMAFDSDTCVIDFDSLPVAIPENLLSSTVNESQKNNGSRRIIDFMNLYRFVRMSTLFGLKDFTDSVYFPATRTGIINSHRMLTHQLIANAPRYGFEKDETIPYNRIARDFLSLLVQLNETSNLTSQRNNRRENSAVTRIANVLESSLLQGSINVQKARFGPPEFIYSHKSNDIPMTRSSSMVTELAPIVLLLKNFIEQGDLLIIEEPEAHLHPAAQQNMAAALAYMVRRGLRILITTHSHYMVEQISTLVRASLLQPEQRKSELRLEGELDQEDIYLDEEEVAIYSFLPEVETDTTHVSRVHFHERYGYTPEDHNAAMSDQFNRNTRVLRAHFRDN